MSAHLLVDGGGPWHGEKKLHPARDKRAHVTLGHLGKRCFLGNVRVSRRARLGNTCTNENMTSIIGHIYFQIESRLLLI